MPSVLKCNFVSENLIKFHMNDLIDVVSQGVIYISSSYHEIRQLITTLWPLLTNIMSLHVKKMMVSVSEFSRSWPAPLSVQLCGGGSLHVLHQGGRCPKAQGSSHQWHAEERPQTAVDGPAERWASHTDRCRDSRIYPFSNKMPCFFSCFLHSNFSCIYLKYSRNKIHYKTN